jgi:hypothetical protein
MVRAALAMGQNHPCSTRPGSAQLRRKFCPINTFP